MPTVIVKNRLPELRAKMSNSVKGLTRALAEAVVKEAKPRAPVRTGELRDSIHTLGINQYRTDVVVDAPHGIFVELGTRYMGAQPFLVPAFEQVRAELIRNPSRFLKLPR